MTADQLRGTLRLLIGNPTVNEVPALELDHFINPSLVWLASELQMDVIEDDDILLVANQIEYPLPRNMAWMIWVEYNHYLLKPTSTYAVNLNTTNVSGGTINWRSAEAGTPTQYAIEGRNLILNPPASQDSILGNPPFLVPGVKYLRWRWIGSADDGLEVSGTPELSDMDQQLVRYDAAIGWLSAHPTDDNTKRIAAYTAEIQRRLPAAKQRWAAPLTSFYPTFSPETQGRFIASRVRLLSVVDKSRSERYTPFKGGPIPCRTQIWSECIPESEKPNLGCVGAG